MREVLVDVLVSMEHWSLYRAALLFVAGYPLLAAVVWVVTALLFYYAGSGVVPRSPFRRSPQTCPR